MSYLQTYTDSLRPRFEEAKRLQHDSDGNVLEAANLLEQILRDWVTAAMVEEGFESTGSLEGDVDRLSKVVYMPKGGIENSVKAELGNENFLRYKYEDLISLNAHFEGVLDHFSSDYTAINFLCEHFNTFLFERKSHHWQKPTFTKHVPKNLPFSIVLFGVIGYQCIVNLKFTLPTATPFVVFTGENGDGKTSILQAIAIALYGTEEGNKLTYLSSFFHIKGYDGARFFYNGFISNHNKFSTKIDALFAYGASRLELQSPESMSQSANRKSPIYSLFHTDGVLQNIEYLLRLLFYKNEARFKMYTEAIIGLLPNITAMRYDESEDSFLYTEKGVEVPAHHLSAGHKSIVAMMGDLMARFEKVQPHAERVQDFAGIVIIDEIEAHLHPNWQRAFPQLLKKTFPKVQFIVSTHSVIPLLGMPEDTVCFVVERNEQDGTTVRKVDLDLKNLLPNQLLTSPLFNTKSIISSENKNPEDVRTEDTYQEVMKNDTLTNDIRELAKRIKAKKQVL